MIKKETLDKKLQALERLKFYQDILAKAQLQLDKISDESMSSFETLWSKHIQKERTTCLLPGRYSDYTVAFKDLFSDGSLTPEEEIHFRMDIIKLHILQIRKSIDYWQKQYAETIKVEVDLG